MFVLGQKLILKRFQVQSVGGFLIYFSIFNQNRAISRDLDHYQRPKMQIKIFQKISDTSLQFSVFP